ncbi:MAG TPA: zinc ribbon domain-containing protein [Solirubrobacteraceae bacterium]|jgi:hypothetical protein|nr:zinc ribbon domain-containing protein [Solirubrobacteraceae bacterium]
MSILGDAIGRSRREGRESPASPAAAAHVAGPPVSPPSLGDERSELRRRRDALAEQVTELHWDLGGLAYEMAIRDHFRLDVLVRRAAALQERDAELAEVERLLRLEESASAGACPACGAPHSRGAVFCWQCGATLMQQRDPGAESRRSRGERNRVLADEGPTTAIDALLVGDDPTAPDGGRRAREDGSQAASFAEE